MNKPTAILLVLFSFSTIIYSQSKARFGIGFDTAIPIGKLSENVKTGFGGTARFLYQTSKKIDLFASFGYITFSGKIVEIDSDTKFQNNSAFIPVMAGIKSFVNSNFYLVLESGVQIIRITSELENIETDLTSTSTKFALEPGIGYLLELNHSLSINAEAKYAFVDNSQYFDVRIGLDIVLE